MTFERNDSNDIKPASSADQPLNLVGLSTAGQDEGIIANGKAIGDNNIDQAKRTLAILTGEPIGENARGIINDGLDSLKREAKIGDTLTSYASYVLPEVWIARKLTGRQ